MELRPLRLAVPADPAACQMLQQLPSPAVEEGEVILPSLKQASTDRCLRGAPLRVLVYLHGVLEIGEYRVLKTWHVAREIGMDRAHVGRAIATLVACGYIREGPRLEHGVRKFMLVANPHKEVA